MAENNEPGQTPSQAQYTSQNPYQPTTEPAPAYNFKNSGYKSSTNTAAQPAPYAYQPQPPQQPQLLQVVPYQQQNNGTGRYGTGRKAKDECCGWRKKTCLICWIVVGVILIIVITLSAVGFYCLANGCGSSSNKNGGGNGILTCNCLQGDPDCVQTRGSLEFSQKCKSKEEQCYQLLRYNDQGRFPQLLERGCRLNPEGHECIQTPNPYRDEQCWCRSSQCLGLFQEDKCDRYCATGTHKQVPSVTASGTRFELESMTLNLSSLVYFLSSVFLHFFPLF